MRWIMRKIAFKTGLIGMALAALVAAATPAMAATWIPGHYNNGYWVPGHWVGGYGVWISGYYGPGGVWYPGHWAGGYGPPPGPYERPPPGPPMIGYHWVPGFYGPYGNWHPGHWVIN